MSGITRAELDGAVRAGIVSAEQADKLAAYLGAAVATAEQPQFTFVHVLYYLGGMIAVGAMTLFMTLGWNALGGGAAASRRSSTACSRSCSRTGSSSRRSSTFRRGSWPRSPS